jgi:two-component system, NtrC family, response regulator AtoC
VRRFLLVLAVVDHPETYTLVSHVFESAGHRVIVCTSLQKALLFLENRLSPDLVLVDGSTNQSGGELALRELLMSVSADMVYVTAGKDDATLPRMAKELGVRNLLPSPITSAALESLMRSLAAEMGPRALSERGTGSNAGDSMDNSGASSPPYLEELDGAKFFLAASSKMLELHRQVKLLADTDVNVLILGESGTGKEVIAQLIHRHSRRARERFLKVNCAALPTELLESELFGHKQGAFTGAIKDHPGKFEQANGGTLLLDEIGEIGVQVQAKLLHVLQDGLFTRLGSQANTKVDVRVLAATNVQMESALLNRSFREDLYYRLSVFTIHVPPLRERREEIPYLIEETIRRAPNELRKGLESRIPSRLSEATLLYDWPGNLRELRNFVTRLIVLRDPEGATRELEAKIEVARESHCAVDVDAENPNRLGMRSVVRDLKERTERQMIEDALEASQWNRRRAARYLNISYRALLYKIQHHHLVPSQKPPDILANSPPLRLDRYSLPTRRLA